MSRLLPSQALPPPASPLPPLEDIIYFFQRAVAAIVWAAVGRDGFGIVSRSSNETASTSLTPAASGLNDSDPRAENGFNDSFF